MIVFDLACTNGHAFEGWFDSAGAYADQRQRDLVRCPVCDDPDVRKRPSARVSTPRHARPRGPRHATPAAADVTQAAHSNGAQQAAAQGMPAMNDIVAGLPPDVLARLREVVRNTENVGERFAEEARKIHYEETPARPIRGKASREEAEALLDEGIEFTALPPSITSETH